MSEKSGIAARHRAATLLLLALTLVLVAAWGVLADDAAPGTNGEAVLYEVSIPKDGFDRLEIQLPPGFVYVGLAAGSEIGEEPSRVEGPETLVWYGLRSGPEVLRIWLEPVDSLAAPGALSIMGLDGKASLTEPAVSILAESQDRAAATVLAGTVTVTKTVEKKPDWPDNLWVTYETTFEYEGGGTATLDAITDTLPAGFEFGGMAFGSDVAVAPSPAGENRYVWYNVEFTDSLVLRYLVKALDRRGEYLNEVVAKAGADLIGPASSTLVVGDIGYYEVFLPIVVRDWWSGPESELPWEDEFSSVNPDWEPFTNYPGLSPYQWAWAGDPGLWGIWNYTWNDPKPNWTGYHLLAYDNPSAESWTDYKIEMRFKDSKDNNFGTGMCGLLFRGTYDPSGAGDGKTVTGYYVYMKPIDNTLIVMRTPSGNPSFAAQETVAIQEVHTGIARKRWYKMVVEVKGDNISVFFVDDEDGNSGQPPLYISWTDPDSTWVRGTVGLATYKTTARYDYIRITSLE